MIYEPPQPEASRYRDVGVKAASAGRKLRRREGVIRTLLRPLPYSKTTSYRVSEGDRIDVMASEVLGDSRLWWILADLNPLAIPDPLRLTPGTEIRLPDGDEADALIAEFG